MIPKKAGTDIDLNAKLDEDLSKAEEQQREEIKKSRPKLAQAVASKYFKIVIIIGVAIGIGYKMFFAPEPEGPKVKKKSTTKIAKQSSSKTEQAQKKLASEKVAKTQSTIEKDKTEIKTIISFDEQTLSNAEMLSKVQVPKMQLPQVPSLPAIDKIVIKEDVKAVDAANTSSGNNNDVNNEKVKNMPDANGAKNMVNEKGQTVGEKAKNDNQQTAKKTIKVRKKVRDERGKMKFVTEEVEINDDANGKKINDIINSPLSQKIKKNTAGKSGSMDDDTDVLPGGKKNNKTQKKNNGKNLSEKALDEMFILSGKGSVLKENKKSSEGKKDFILFDGASITASEIINQSSQASNVSKMQNLENTIAAGKIIEATLETAINSETAGTIRAVVAKDVYGETGNKILIPRGSRLYGSYATTSTTTQTRLLLTWTKVIRPDGIVISMSADTYDRIGKKGIEGDIDTRYGELFKNSLLYSFVTLGTAIAIEKLAGIKGGVSVSSNYSSLTTNTSPANAAAQSVISTAQDIAEKMTDGYTDDLNPIISIPQGMLLKIISSTDIVVDVAYKRRLKNIELD